MTEKRKPGRPKKPAEERAVKVIVYLSPDQLMYFNMVYGSVKKALKLIYTKSLIKKKK